MTPVVPITLDFARSFLKADGDDDELITSQIAQAQSICEGYCNRVFYSPVVDEDTGNITTSAAEVQQADFIEALTDRADALANRATALAAVTGTTGDDDVTCQLITDHYIEVLGSIGQRVNGIVLDGTINAAILITLGHLYKNREDNVSTGNNVVQVPVGAQRILQPKLWIGNLADGGIPLSLPITGS